MGFQKLTTMLAGLLISAAAIAGPEHDFILAAKMDDVRTVKKLLNKGISPNLVDAVTGEPAMLLALREGSAGVIDELLAAKGLQLEQQAPNGNTALMMAAFKRNKTALARLLARGAAVNRPGWTALHYAAAGGDAEITALLIKHGARLNARAVAGITPLMMAAREGQEEAVAVLLRAGADATLVNSEQHNAAQVADKADKPRIAAAIAPYLK